MIFICRKFTGLGEYKSEAIIDSKIDKYGTLDILSTQRANDYCLRYLTTESDFKEDCYWICFKK